MIRYLPITLALVAFGLPVAAKATLSLPIEIGAEGDVRSISYTCADGTDLTVQYINAGANSLAVIPLEGQDMIFVNVIAGSGARYVAGAREWWTKGNSGTLRDETSKANPVTCTAKTEPSTQ